MRQEEGSELPGAEVKRGADRSHAGKLEIPWSNLESNRSAVNQDKGDRSLLDSEAFEIVRRVS